MLSNGNVFFRGGMVTIEIVINSTRVMGIRVTMSCRYCIAFEVMILVSSCKYKRYNSCNEQVDLEGR